MQSAGTRTKDGRLWFPTQDGVAIVDPRAVTARRVSAPAVIERIVAGDSSVIPSGARVSFGVDQRNLTIEYTALSLLEPKNLRFRYRLEPYDAAWVDAGNRRTAFYTRVPPGSYTFRVQASSPDAEWTSVGAELPLSLAFLSVGDARTFRFGGLVAAHLSRLGGAAVESAREAAPRSSSSWSPNGRPRCASASSSSRGRTCSSRSSTARSRASSPTCRTSSGRRSPSRSVRSRASPMSYAA